MTRPAPVDIGEDDPITLAEACRLFFGGRLTPSALRTEATKGNLDIMQIARKDFVTRRAIEEMKARCLVSRVRPASGFAQTQEPGSSRTAPNVSAQDALRMMLKEPSLNSRAISQGNTNRNAGVVPLKSR